MQRRDRRAKDRAKAVRESHNKSLTQPTEPRRAAAGATSHPVKVRDPALDAALADFRARGGKIVSRPQPGSRRQERPS